MKQRRRLTIAAAGFLLLLFGSIWFVVVGFRAGADKGVPDWFKPDPNDPYEIFQKWRHLDSPEAALFLGPEWIVCGGELRDAEGVPIADSILEVNCEMYIRAYSATLKTDGQGRFVIYGPHEGVPLDLERVSFRAAHGYPFSKEGERFAAIKKDWHWCRIDQTLVSDDISFVCLTRMRDTRFDAEAFREFDARVNPGARQDAPGTAAMRGVVVDAGGRPVTGITSINIRGEHEELVYHKPGDHRFGTRALTPGVHRLKVKAKGFEVHESEDILLAPGELRFVRVVLKGLP